MTMPLSATDRLAIQDLITKSALYLDDGDYTGFLGLCSGDFRYSIIVPSPELRRDMVWLDHDRAGLEALFDALPEHLVRLGRLMRHLSPAQIDTGEAESAARADSPVAIYDTRPDGQSGVFALARYVDVILLGERPRLHTRRVILHTRDIGTGSHIPL